jgi:hypothetical protein
MTMGLTYAEAKKLGIEQYWPGEHKDVNLKTDLPLLPQDLARQPAAGDGMNKMERKFYDCAKARFGDSALPHDSITLRLAGRTRYTPDFPIIENGKLVFWEIKGWMRDDAAVKIKVAADKYPMFTFILATRRFHHWQCSYVTHSGIQAASWCPEWLK